MSTQLCGCDPEAYYRCADYPNCYVGKENQKLTSDFSKPFNQVTMPTRGIAQPARNDTPGSLRCSEAAMRKEYPLSTGCLEYFPDALMEVAHVSFIGNQQHNPGQPLHWDRAKSTDEADALLRHQKDHGTRDSDGMRHSAKVAWRALAQLQKELEQEREDR